MGSYSLIFIWDIDTYEESMAFDNEYCQDCFDCWCSTKCNMVIVIVSVMSLALANCAVGYYFGARGKPKGKKKKVKTGDVKKGDVKNMISFVVAVAKMVTLTSCTYGLHELTLLDSCDVKEPPPQCIVSACCAVGYMSCDYFCQLKGCTPKPLYDRDPTDTEQPKQNTPLSFFYISSS